MVSKQPYQYTHTRQTSVLSTDSTFDPKAVTRASWIRPEPKPNPTGPLLDFNQHPDSYDDATSQLDRLQRIQRNQRLLEGHRGLVKTVKSGRLIQLMIRCSQVIVSLGLLVCVICLKNVQMPASWLIRLPVGISLLAAVYAIYSLLSSRRTGKTPGSTASYHFFALVIDLCLVGFFAFTAILARSSLLKAVGDDTRWQSIIQPGVSTPNFETASLAADNQLTRVTAGLAVAAGVVHLLAAILSMVLLLAYRRAAALPPDLNPLDSDNSRLTSRRHRILGLFGRKAGLDHLPHQRTSSSATVMEEKGSKGASPRGSYLSSQSAVNHPPAAVVADQPSPRNGKGHVHGAFTGVGAGGAGGVTKGTGPHQTRPVSFFETRNNNAFSAHTPGTAHHVSQYYQQMGGDLTQGPVGGTFGPGGRPNGHPRHGRSDTMGSVVSQGGGDAHPHGRQSWIVHNPDSTTTPSSSSFRAHSRPQSFVAGDNGVAAVAGNINNHGHGHGHMPFFNAASLTSSTGQPGQRRPTHGRVGSFTNNNHQQQYQHSFSMSSTTTTSGMGPAGGHPAHSRTQSIESLSCPTNRPKRYRNSRPGSVCSLQEGENVGPGTSLLGRPGAPPSSFMARVGR